MFPTVPSVLRGFATKAHKAINAKAAALSAAGALALSGISAHATLDTGLVTLLDNVRQDGTQLATLFLIGYGAIAAIKVMRRAI